MSQGPIQPSQSGHALRNKSYFPRMPPFPEEAPVASSCTITPNKASNQEGCLSKTKEMQTSLGRRRPAGGLRGQNGFEDPRDPSVALGKLVLLSEPGFYDLSLCCKTRVKSIYHGTVEAIAGDEYTYPTQSWTHRTYSELSANPPMVR